MYQEPTIDSTVHTNITVYETTQNIQVAKVIFSVSLIRIQVKCIFIHSEIYKEQRLYSNTCPEFIP